MEDDKNKKRTLTPSNDFFQIAMEDIRVARGFFRQHLPADIQKNLDFDSLQLESNDFINKQYKRRYTDVIYSAQLKGETGYFVALTEHQSKPDKLMPFRLLEYMVLICRRHLKEHETDTLPIVWCTVLYNGARRWHYSTRLLDLYPKEYQGLARRIFNEQLKLVDLNNIADEELRADIWAGVLQMGLQAKIKRYAMHIKPLLEKLAQLLPQIEGESGGADLIESVVYYITEIGDSEDPDFEPREYLEIVAEKLQSKGRVMTIAEKLKQQGIEQGMQQGIQQGIQTVALNLLRQKVDIATIVKATQLSIAEVEQIKEEQELNTDH